MYIFKVMLIIITTLMIACTHNSAIKSSATNIKNTKNKKTPTYINDISAENNEYDEFEALDNENTNIDINTAITQIPDDTIEKQKLSTDHRIQQLTKNNEQPTYSKQEQPPYQYIYEQGDTEENNTNQLSISSKSLLYWVGYDYSQEQSLVQIQLEIKNAVKPRIQIYWLEDSSQEEPKLIIKCYNTNIRKGINRDIDASEFPTPVKYIKIQKDNNDVLIIIFLTNKITPKILSNDNTINLSFEIPKTYLEDTFPKEEQNNNLQQDNNLKQDSQTNNISTYKNINHTDLIELKNINLFNVAQASEQDFTQENLKSNNSNTKYESQQSDSPNTANETTYQTTKPQQPSDSAANEVYTNTPKSTQSNEMQTIRMEFYKAPLREVLKAFSDQSGINFIFSEAVGNTPVTIRLENVPWDAALKAILDTNHLVMTKIGENIIRVDQIQQIQSYIDAKDQASIASLKAEDTKILVIKLSNAEATKIESQLRNMLQLGKFGDKVKISADQRTNTILIEAPPVILQKTKAIVERLDLPTPQVEIASRIIEVNRSINNFLGISWTGGLYYDAGRGLGFGTLPFPNSISAPFVIDPGVAKAQTAGALNVNIGSLNDAIDLDLRLRMEEVRGMVEVLQSNKIVVGDREQATIRAGMTEFFKTTSSPTIISTGGNVQQSAVESGLVSVNYDLTLTVTPYVTSDGRVNMKLNITSDSPASAATTGAQASKNTRSLSTTLLKKSGETAVIGGIFDNKKRKTITGIPVLSYLPIIGALFRSTNYSENQIELMVLITPTILPQTSNTVQTTKTAINTQDIESTHTTNNTQEDGQDNQENNSIQEEVF